MQTLFPKLTEPQIRQYLLRTSSLEEAAEVAASHFENLEETKTTELSITTIDDIFRKLSLKMSLEKKSICIDQDNIVSDLLSYYKEHTFDASLPWRVTFKDQAGIDAGGLTRELFHQFFRSLSNSAKGNHLFEGEKFQQLPVNRTDTCISGVFRYIGIVMAHCLCLGVRPILLPESAFRYIVTGSIEQAVPYVTVESSSEALKHFSKEV